MTNAERDALITQGWTPPPEPVDPDIAEADKIWRSSGHCHGQYIALNAIKRGRELERQTIPKWERATGGNGVIVTYFDDGTVEIVRSGDWLPDGRKPMRREGDVTWPG